VKLLQNQIGNHAGQRRPINSRTTNLPLGFLFVKVLLDAELPVNHGPDRCIFRDGKPAQVSTSQKKVVGGTGTCIIIQGNRNKIFRK